MMINPDLISPCGLYCGVCAIYIAYRDNNDKFKERLVNLYREKFPVKVLFLIVKTFRQKILNAVAAYLMNSLCIAGSVRSGPAQKRKVTPDVTNAMNFLVGIFKIFP